MTDLGALYANARRRIAALVGAEGVDPQLAVPATPGWSVHDVVAHLTGVAADAVSGNMDGAPGEAWTAAQVARGRGRSIADLLAEWDTCASGLEAVLSGPGGGMASAAVMDVHTHEADLRHALGLTLELPADMVSWAGASLREAFAKQVARAGLPAVEVSMSDVEWFRARLGRRTAAEVRSLPWSADPSPYLGVFFVFGPASVSLGEV